MIPIIRPRNSSISRVVTGVVGMDEHSVLSDYLVRTRGYLTEKLIPFWAERIVDPEFGGFQANYDEDGKRTSVREKSLLCQARTLFTFSHCLRQGFDWPGAQAQIAQGIQFLHRHFLDGEYGGYYWMVDADGSVLEDKKVLYGHSFLIYGFAEYALLTGDAEALENACRLFDLIQSKARDEVNGGYIEHFHRNFEVASSDGGGRVLKSLDVHMHLMEAFTTLYECTREAKHKAALEDVITLIFNRMIDPDTGTGVSMFTRDWGPVGNTELGTVWGADRFADKEKPPEVTSFGHNLEFAWLYLHSLDILGVPAESQRDRLLPIFDHALKHGVDRVFGGLYVEGTRQGVLVDDHKEFWQQAEALVGFLAAYGLTGERRYLEAFRTIHDFVFSKMIHPALGEWYCLLGRKGDVLRPYLGSNWKICYHTLRAVSLVVKRLEALLERATFAEGGST